MWRPDLQRLPCRRTVKQTTEANGRRSYAMLEAVSPGFVLEISVCLEVSLNVVDQFPFLWDFVLIDATSQAVCPREDEAVCWQPVYSYA